MENRLLDVNETAGVLGVGTRTVWRMRDAGRMPTPVKVAGCIRWRLADLSAWIDAGCPDVRRTGWVPPATAAGCAGGCKCGRVGQ